MDNYYNQKYFDWQCEAGVRGARFDLWKFSNLAKPTDKILDFGCGGGFILAALPGADKWGIEINSSAREEANKKIKAVASLEELPGEIKYDLIISNHALEHVRNPFLVLTALKSFLNENGKIVFVVPVDNWKKQTIYDSMDVNKHLFTWTPLLIGNLFSEAGYKVISVEMFRHTWFPFSKTVYKYLPKFLFDLLCSIWGILSGNRQIRIIAGK